MKKVLALTAGVLVALAPSGTAFAGEHESVPGKAYGNCGHSSAGGNPHTGLLRPEYNKGNGGLVELAKKDRTLCVAPGTTLNEEDSTGDVPPVVIGPAPR